VVSSQKVSPLFRKERERDGYPAASIKIHDLRCSRGLGREFLLGTLTVGKIPTCSLFRAVHCDSISAGPLHRSASDESWFVFSSSAQSAPGLKSVADEHPRQANLGRGTNLISNQRLRLSSKHPPMKERIHTTTAVTIPAQKTGLS